MIENNKILLSHVNDLVSSVKKGRKYAFTSFLNEEQFSCVMNYIKSCRIDCLSFGGYADAERCIIGFGYDELPHNYNFPISTLTFDFNERDDISHRHVLGALMSLGIKRELIGDIIFINKKCFFFVDSKIADFICMNLLSVSSIGINVYVTDETFDYKRTFEDITCIVASMRLDCVVCGLTNKSRTTSAEIIETGLVYINGIQCLKRDKIISHNDVISIRKTGKFRINGDLGSTKKNRIKLQILKYI